MEQRTEAFCSDNHTSGVEGGAVVVARVEEGVVVSTLQLKASFQNLRGYVCGCRSEITEKA
jgi:hypothetical protein